jgi:lantibiotic modifying enzyme
MHASLSTGRAGVAVLFAYAYASLGEPRYRETALSLLDDAIGTAAVTSLPAGLHDGFTGIGWAIEYLRKLFGLEEQEDPNEETDRRIEQILRLEASSASYDLVSGLVGIGVYCLERLPSPAGLRCAELVAKQLAQRAERDGRAARWHTAPGLLPEYQRLVSPDGYYNVGMAHGVPGAIAWLARAHSVGISETGGQSLLDEAIAWLLSQRRDRRAGTTFPAWVGVGADSGTSVLGWCYGDPGVAASLVIAGECLGQESWIRAGVSIAGDAAASRTDLPVDPGFCHGVAGLAHVYNRLSQISGSETLRKSAAQMCEKLLDMRGSSGVAGYTFRRNLPGSNMAFLPAPGLLVGAAGVALTLLAAVSEVPPDWDRVFLLST